MNYTVMTVGDEMNVLRDKIGRYEVEHFSRTVDLQSVEALNVPGPETDKVKATIQMECDAYERQIAHLNSLLAGLEGEPSVSTAVLAPEAGPTE